MITLKIIGGLFLIYLAIQALRAHKSSYNNLDISEPAAGSKSTTSAFLMEFIAGFMSGILNPKNLLFYLSLFTVVLTPEVGFAFKLGLGIWMTAVVFFWDLFIIFLLSTRTMRKKFTKAAYYIDKITGALLGMIGFVVLAHLTGEYNVNINKVLIADYIGIAILAIAAGTKCYLNKAKRD